MMKKTLMASILFLACSISWADSESALGIDYLKVTRNELLAEITLKIEPQLIAYYQQGEYENTTKRDRVFAIRSTATMLGMDKLSEYTVSVLESAAPEVPLEFLKLDKSKYPNLWNFGELERLQREKAESQRLYDALHMKK